MWWGLVPHGDMILYFHCTIFAGLEMGTLVARQFLPTLKIFFQKKKKKHTHTQFARLWHQNTQGPLVLLLNMIIGEVKIVE